MSVRLIRNSVFKRLQQACVAVLCLSAFSSAHAATVVSLQTALGNYKVELYEDLAPNLVARFLSEVEKGTYHFSFVHFVSNTFYVGGRYVFNTCSVGPEEINFGAPIPAEETGLLNTTGAFALVRNQDNPSELTGEYLINLGDNTSAPASVSPIVIGRVIDGMDVANTIGVAWRVPMNISLDVPTVGYDGIFAVQCGLFNRDNLIQTVFVIDSVDTGNADDPANFYEPTSGRVNVKVDAGSEGLLSLQFEIVQTEPQVIIQVVPGTVAALSETVTGISSFDGGTGLLTLPELSIDGTVTYTNMVFSLSSVEQLQFTLQSFSQP